MSAARLCLAVALLAAATAAAPAQQPPAGDRPAPAPAPSSPYPSVPWPLPPPGSPSSLFPDLFSPIRSASAPDTTPAAPAQDVGMRSGRPELLGDMPPLPVIARTPDGTPVAVPSVRSFKISDFESPEPQDRLALTQNTFLNLYSDLNRQFGADVHNIDVAKQTLLFERKVLDGEASLGARLPLYVTGASGSIPDLQGKTSLGDLSLIGKCTLADLPEEDLYFSGGLAVTVPSGASSLFESAQFARIRSVLFQPFLGYRWQEDRLTVVGFSSLETPTDWRDVTLMFNDVSCHYLLYQGEGARPLINSLVALAELHLTTPLNHRGISATDPNGTPDILDLTAAIQGRFLNRIKLVTGLVVPLTRPSPFSLEVISQLRFVY